MHALPLRNKERIRTIALVIDATREKICLELLFGMTKKESSMGFTMEDSKHHMSYKEEFQCERLNEVLLANIGNMLNRFNLSLHDINMVGVNHGPGTYSGIRISVIIAKTLAYFLNIPIYSFDGFIVLNSWLENVLFEQWYQDTRLRSFEKNNFRLFISNSHKNKFFMVGYLENLQFGEIAPFDKNIDRDKHMLKKLLSHKDKSNVENNIGKSQDDIVEWFGKKCCLTDNEVKRLANHIHKKNNVEGINKIIVDWFFFDIKSNNNFLNFLEIPITNNPSCISWEQFILDVEDSKQSKAYQQLGSYRQILENQMQSTTGEVMKVMPNYYRNFGE